MRKIKKILVVLTLLLGFYSNHQIHNDTPFFQILEPPIFLDENLPSQH